MALILEMMALRKKSLEEILNTIPKFYSSGAKVECSAGKAVELIRELSSKFADANPNLIDGLRLDWEDSWVLIRASNTEPIIRIFAEALTQEKADQLVKKFIGLID